MEDHAPKERGTPSGLSSPPAGESSPGKPLSAQADSRQRNDEDEPPTIRGSPLSLTQQADLPVRHPLPSTGESDASHDRGGAAAGIGTHGGTQHDTDREPSAALGLQPGDVLGERYEVRRCLGVGGMGAVFAAYDRVRQEEIALKVLLPRLLQDPAARQRFAAEAKIASSLSHENIVRVYDIQQDGERCFLTMELLQGCSLREEMQRRAAKQQRFTIDEVRRIGGQLCRALEHAHRETIHRDVKPENIWLGADGTVKLMDFGIARLLRPSQFTTMGMQLGTAYYIAPEQLRGQKEIDHRADQYAAGVVLYELLTGEIPQGAIKSPRQVRKSVPEGLSDAIMRALDGSPEARFPDMAALERALRENASGASQRARRWGMAAAACLVLLTAGSFPVWRGPVTHWWRLQTAGQWKSQAGTSRQEAEKEWDSWVTAAARLPKELHPSTVAEAEKRLKAGDEAEKSLDFVAAAKAYQDATALLRDAKTTEQQISKQYTDAQTALKGLQSTEQQWLVLAKDVDGSRVPADAASAATSAAAAKAAWARHDLALAQQLAAEAVAEYERAAQALSQTLARETAEARAQAQVKLDAAEQLGDRLRQKVRDAQEQVQRLERSEEAVALETARSVLVSAQQVLRLYEDNSRVPGWLQEAKREMAVGDSPALRDQPAAATACYRRAVEALEQIPQSFQNHLALLQAPFSAAEAAQAQQVWSRVLGQPVELTNSLGMRLRLIPPGEFMMGTRSSEVDDALRADSNLKREWLDDEQPQHRVRITRPFYLGAYEVTQSEYEAVMGSNPSHFKGPTLPVEQVSWADAEAFCRKLSVKEDREYRLPTEAEWEYACRAGTTTTFSFGSSLNGEQANRDGNRETVSAGSYRANGFGLYDMHGNVWEWCADWYGDYATAAVDDPTGPASGSFRVSRGGGWGSGAGGCRSAYRGRYSPGYRDISLGFRVASSSVDATSK